MRTETIASAARYLTIATFFSDPAITSPATTSYEMAKVVNLGTERKRAAREKAERGAAENRLAHGVAKSDRERAAADRESRQHSLDQLKIETGGRP